MTDSTDSLAMVTVRINPPGSGEALDDEAVNNPVTYPLFFCSITRPVDVVLPLLYRPSVLASMHSSSTLARFVL